MRWRKIECSLRVEIKSEGVCINGVLYYLGYMWEEMSEATSNYVIVCFDVRSEKFKFIYPESLRELINYKGKLGVIYNDDFTDDAIELRVWVLEDVEKHEWTKYAYTLRGDKLFPHYASEVGVISTGEIMLSMADYTSKQPFYIDYFNPERNTIRRVEIQASMFHVYKEEEYEDDKYGFRRFMVKRGRKQMEIKPTLTGAPDKLSWLGTKTGCYTTKSSYATALSSRTDPTEISQDVVWNLKTSPKTKLFAWKVLHGAIPAGEALRARQINIWSSAPVIPSIEYNESIELRRMWIELVTRKNLPPTGVAAGQLAPWILWSIWTERNNLVFNDKPLSAAETLSKAIALAREWGSCQLSPPPTTRTYAPPPPPSDPPTDCTLIKTDAAWSESRNIAALALWEALSKCRELGLSRIRCESDSAVLIKAIKAETSLAGLYGILADIQSLASSFECISFHWISRLRNAKLIS
ncbi:hypothetical protein YC2023_098520 [Brassica napus]